jgi:hypothetical protein
MKKFWQPLFALILFVFLVKATFATEFIINTPSDTHAANLANGTGLAGAAAVIANSTCI